mmetsp:Transcript_59126/g.157340  ORF Transcript_59126/g.157340 Transcript_59126/m.157340 type:complete len:84 (-) Transcript_59126:1818-2069(-)
MSYHITWPETVGVRVNMGVRGVTLVARDTQDVLWHMCGPLIKVISEHSGIRLLALHTRMSGLSSIMQQILNDMVGTEVWFQRT